MTRSRTSAVRDSPIANLRVGEPRVLLVDVLASDPRLRPVTDGTPRRARRLRRPRGPDERPDRRRSCCTASRTKPPPLIGRRAMGTSDSRSVASARSTSTGSRHFCACSTPAPPHDVLTPAADTARGRLTGWVVAASGRRPADRRSRSTATGADGNRRRHFASTADQSRSAPRHVHEFRQHDRTVASRRHRWVTGSNGRSPQRLNTIMGHPF